MSWKTWWFVDCFLFVFMAFHGFRISVGKNSGCDVAKERSIHFWHWHEYCSQPKSSFKPTFLPCRPGDPAWPGSLHWPLVLWTCCHPDLVCSARWGPSPATNAPDLTAHLILCLYNLFLVNIYKGKKRYQTKADFKFKFIIFKCIDNNKARQLVVFCCTLLSLLDDKFIVMRTRWIWKKYTASVFHIHLILQPQ